MSGDNSTRVDALDASPVVLEHVKQFTIGFGRAGGQPSALGSGVLVRSGEMSGILTCAHVDKFLRENGRIGLVNLNRGQAFQAAVLNMNEVMSLAAGEEPWPISGPDIAFIHLPPHIAEAVAARFTFLNADKNFSKPERPDLPVVLAACGLIEEYSGPTTRQGELVTTGLKAVLTPGNVVVNDGDIVSLECLPTNVPDLPQSFGGLSGGGLWQVFLSQHDRTVEHFRLVGIASRQDL